MKKSITIFFITIINILCITTAFADDLENAKTSAKTELSSIYSLYDEFDYTEANWLELESAYNNGIASIEAAITEEGAYTALNDAAENMISVRHGNKIITACISVENLVLQKGFIIFPEFVKVPKYQPLSKAISRLFENKNPKISQPLIISGTIEKDFQILSAYQGINTNLDDPDEASVPNYLIKYVGKELPEPVDKTYLNSGDYTQDSCFVYSVNNKFPNVKASAIPVVDEDVIRFQFSIYGKGADVGAATQSSDEPVITPSDKSDLYITFAEIIQKNDIDLLLSNPDNKEKFNDALVVAEMVNVSQLAVDRALKKLRSLEPVTEAPPSSLPDEDKPVETPEEPPTTPPQEEEENEA
ncbi:MAG: hypothetical protein IJ300_08275, partial [Clostridia bacterium]|nr:hypothetical protein [Clostridia bacterium]